MDVNKFVRNALKEMKIENLETVSEHQDCNRSSKFELLKKEQQASDTSQKIKLEPHFSYNFHEKPTSTPISHSINQNISEENRRRNYALVGKYKTESSQSTLKPEILNDSDLHNFSPEIQEGNTSRLTGLWEASNDLTDKKKYNNPDQVGAVPKIRANDQHFIEEDNAFQLGRQKGIRDILSSLVSPYTPSVGPTKFKFDNTLDSPDLSLSFLERENMKLLDKLATSSSPMTNSDSITNFEDTSIINIENVSKDETRVYSHRQGKEKKIKRDDATIELEDKIKVWLKPFYNTDVISKEDYKRIMLKCIKKISCLKGEHITPATIRRLVEFFIKKHRMENSIVKSNKKTRKASSNESSLSAPKLPRSKNQLEDAAKNVINSMNKKIKATDCVTTTNIKINIKHSCCKKDSLSNDSHKIVISSKKSNEVRRWRY